MIKKGDKFEETLEPSGLHEDKIVETVRIQQVKGKGKNEGKQSFYIRIPMKVVDELQIKKGSKFIFEVHLEKNPMNNKGYFRLGD